MFCYNDEKKQHSQDRNRNSSAMAVSSTGDSSETAQLLTQEETSLDSALRGSSIENSATAANNFNSSHLPDDGIVAGLQQIRKQPQDRASLVQGESIPMSTLSRTLGSRHDQDGCQVMHANGGYYKRVPTTEVEDDDEEDDDDDLVVFKLREDGDTAASNNMVPLVLEEKSSQPKKYLSRVRNSILPQLWKALVQDKDTSKKEQKRENDFSSLASPSTSLQPVLAGSFTSARSGPSSSTGHAEAASQGH